MDDRSTHTRPSEHPRARLGVVRYLNTRPLVAGLAERGFSIFEAVPSECWRLLRRGEVDLGIIPSFCLVDDPSLIVVPEVSIASRGPVRSVVLLTRYEPERLRTVALDSSSRSSAALVQIVLAEEFGVKPQFSSGLSDWRSMLSAHDAALVIGDQALAAVDQLRAADAKIQIIDLGEVWSTMTGLPFVFAVWAGREERVTPEIASALIAARDRGVADLAATLPDGLDPDTRARHLDYLQHAVHYELGEHEIAGLERFLELAERHGVAARRPSIRFADRSLAAPRH